MSWRSSPGNPTPEEVQHEAKLESKAGHIRLDRAERLIKKARATVERHVFKGEQLQKELLLLHEGIKSNADELQPSKAALAEAEK